VKEEKETRVSEHAEDPVGHASSKIVQYVSLATMAAEALAQRAQQRQAAAAATDHKATAAVRAQQTGARNAARLQWQPVLDPRRGARTCLGDAGLAWAASQAWRDIDPEAALASDRALMRMRELRPDVMARFDRLTGDGLDHVEAMRRVAPFFDRPAAREHGSVNRPGLAVGEPDASLQATDASTQLAARTAVVDDPRTARVDERLDADALTEPHLTEAAARAGRAGVLQLAADQSQDVALAASGRTQPQLASDAYPEPLTGEVLAAGKVKPRTPDRTAPAAVRSTGLATAARAAHTSSGGRGR
jgi:hypothetical protein